MNKDQTDAIKPIVAAITSELLDLITKHPNQPIYRHEGGTVLRNGKRVRVLITVYDDEQPFTTAAYLKAIQNRKEHRG